MHFLEYAAGDVRHILLLAETLADQCTPHVPVQSVEQLSAWYVDHYAVGGPVVREADERPAEVNRVWLERFIGEGGVCSHCGARGHTEAECFKRVNGQVKCTFCGQGGHTARNCFKRYPQLLKCEQCGQLGHTADSCFVKNPCRHCGGRHNTMNCHRHRQSPQSSRPSSAGHTVKT